MRALANCINAVPFRRQTMHKSLLVALLSFVLSPFHLESQSANELHTPRLAPSNCGNAHGWMRISTAGIAGDLTCFSPEINRGYASIGGGGVNGRDDVSIQMNFLSRSGTHSCKTPMVVIEFREGPNKWDAYRVRNGQFGECTITQTFENGRWLWKGHASASLVKVRGDSENGSPRRLHSEKDRSGNPVTKTVEVEWVFDHLGSPTTLSVPAKSPQ